MNHTAVEVIRTKRDGGTLSDEQIDWVIDAYTRHDVADEQMAALAMAVFLNGMSSAEMARWTHAMIDSGTTLSWPVLTVDKHSTGGVGDKITLALVPLVAACGVAVPQLAGRGLAYTGGTIDKLESITGWRASLSADEMRAQLRSVGAVICSPTDELVPADRKLYALRDVTATVECVPLIASSIMAKKIAAGSDAVVLDVKVGSGAFMTSLAEARELASAMVSIGARYEKRVTAVLTNMATPLGRAVGNAIEVAEAVDVLKGGGPDDVVELTLALAAEMLSLAGVEADPSAMLASGAAYEKWAQMITAQGGDPDAPLPQPKVVHVLTAPRDGFVSRLDARAVGVAAWRLGAGRARKEDPVQPTAGVVCHAKPGEHVVKGAPLLELHTDLPGAVDGAVAALAGAYDIADDPPPATPLILETMRSG